MKTTSTALVLALFSFFTSHSQPLAPSPSIGANKMNVVYLGLENPLTIGTSTSWDNVLVSTDNGTISGTGAHRILRPERVGQAIITVVAKNHVSTFPFRVKHVPNPIVRLEARNRSISVESFKKIKNLSLCYENFDFDLTPQPAIKSASISFTLPNCSFEFQLKDNDLTVLQSIHHLIVPGTVVKIYNVIYTDSFGERSLDGTSYVLY